MSDPKKDVFGDVGSAASGLRAVPPSAITNTGLGDVTQTGAASGEPSREPSAAASQGTATPPPGAEVVAGADDRTAAGREAKARKTAGAHFEYLDGWRGIAIALVLEEHFFGVLPLEDGRMGVDVFFCLSGFLMSGLLFVQRQPLATFYKRRISRILPAFLAFVAAAYILAAVADKPFTGGEVVATLFFLRTYVPASPGIWEPVGVPIGHLWSLNIEEHCYVLMSGLLFLRLLRGREGYVLMLFGLVCIGVGFVYVGMGDNAPHWGMIGTEVAAAHLMLAAGYRLVREQRGITVPSWLPLATLVMATLCYTRLTPWWAMPLLSPPLLAFTVNHLRDTHGAFKSILSVAPLRQLGIWSYSIYLWQQPFYFYAKAMPWGSVTALPAAIAMALVSFYLLEKPCRTWLNQRW